jgi:hypothetical protein
MCQRAPAGRSKHHPRDPDRWLAGAHRLYTRIREPRFDQIDGELQLEPVRLQRRLGGTFRLGLGDHAKRTALFGVYGHGTPLPRSDDMPSVMSRCPSPLRRVAPVSLNDAARCRVTNLLNLLDEMINAPKDEQLVIIFGFPSRSAVVSLAAEGVRRTGRVDSAFYLMELNDGLLSKLSHSIQLAQIMVILGFQFGEGAIYGGMSFGQGVHEVDYALGQSAVRF